MGSDFGGGYSLLPPIVEGKVEKMNTKSSTLPVINSGLKINGNNMDNYSNSMDKYNVFNYLNAHSEELDVIHRRRRRNNKPGKDHPDRDKTNNAVVNGEIDKTGKDLPTVPFHSILDKLNSSRTDFSEEG